MATLPHALTYLAEDALTTSLKAASLEPGARRGRNVVDGGPTALFHDVCCAPSSTVAETLSFCDRAADAPGADAVYEPYVKYLSDDIYAIRTAVSPLLAEAAASVELCAYYCGFGLESGSTRISIPIERPRNPQTTSGGTATLLS